MELTCSVEKDFDIFCEEGFSVLFERANGFVRLFIGGELYNVPFDFKGRYYLFSASMQTERFILQLAYSGVKRAIDLLDWRLDLELFRFRKNSKEFKGFEPSTNLIVHDGRPQVVDCVFRATRRPKAGFWLKRPEEGIISVWPPEEIIPSIIRPDWFRMDKPEDLSDAQIGMLIASLNIVFMTHA